MKKLFLTIVGLFFVTNLSYANPTYDATQGALQNNSALCGYGYNPNCSSRNYPKKRIEYINVYLPSKFGALAYSQQKGLVTGVLNMNSKAEAENEAIKKCKHDSRSPCKVVSWVKNGCLAAAAGKFKGKYMVSTGADEQGKAESTVLKQCQATGATECKIILSEGCSIP